MIAVKFWLPKAVSMMAPTAPIRDLENPINKKPRKKDSSNTGAKMTIAIHSRAGNTAVL